MMSRGSVRFKVKMVGEPSSLLLKGREKSGVCQAQSLCFLGMLDRFGLGVWFGTSGAATKEFSENSLIVLECFLSNP